MTTWGAGTGPLLSGRGEQKDEAVGLASRFPGSRTESRHTTAIDSQLTFVGPRLWPAHLRRCAHCVFFGVMAGRSPGHPLRNRTAPLSMHYALPRLVSLER